jgi:hypothetical protein
VTPNSETCSDRYCTTPLCLNIFCKNLKIQIKSHLQTVMAQIDLDSATSKEISVQVERLMPDINLTKYKKFIDNEVQYTRPYYILD